MLEENKLNVKVESKIVNTGNPRKLNVANSLLYLVFFNNPKLATNLSLYILIQVLDP